MRIEDKEQFLSDRRRLFYYFDGKEWNYKLEENLEVSDLVYSNIHQESEQIRQKIQDGEVSPLAYYIHMRFSGSTGFFTGRSSSIDLLSSYTGIAKRQIKKHLIPKYFCQLDDETLQKYAEAFDISIEELINIAK